MTVQYEQCRYTKRSGDLCTAEALSAEIGDIKICARHAAMVMGLVQERAAEVKAAKLGMLERRPA